MPPGVDLAAAACSLSRCPRAGHGMRGGWASCCDDGPELAGDVQHGGADAADTACFLVGEGSAVVVSKNAAGAGVGMAPAGDVDGDGVGIQLHLQVAGLGVGERPAGCRPGGGAAVGAVGAGAGVLVWVGRVVVTGCPPSGPPGRVGQALLPAGMACRGGRSGRGGGYRQSAGSPERGCAGPRAGTCVPLAFRP